MRANWEDLQLLLRRFQPVCVALQETMVTSYCHPPPSGYSVFYSPHGPAQGHHGGTALLIPVSQGAAFSHFSLNSTLQAVAIQLHLMRVFTICSLYLPPNTVERRYNANRYKIFFIKRYANLGL